MIKVEGSTHIVYLADPDIFIEPKIVTDEILEYYAHAVAHRCQIIFAQVDSVEQDAAFSRIVQTSQQLCKSGLAGAVLANEGDSLSWPQPEADVADRPGVATRVSKSDVIEFKPLDYEVRDFGRAGSRRYRGLHLKEFEKVLQVQALLDDVAGAHQESLNQGAASLKGTGQKCQ